MRRSNASSLWVGGLSAGGGGGSSPDARSIALRGQAPRAAGRRAADPQIALLALVVIAAASCTRPPLSGGPPPPPPPGRVGPVAFDTFVQDRPAIAGKWYDYNDQDHSVTPKQEAWIVKDQSAANVTSPSTFAAFRITSGYDPNTAALGVFSLSIATFDGTTWSSETAFTASKNIQDGVDDCVDLFTASEVDCASSTWQLRLSAFQYFAPSAGIAIKDPGLFVRSLDGTDAFGDVKIARLDAADLGALPDPTSLADLADAPPSSFASTDWDFTKLGADLPRAGMAIGSQLGADDVWWLMTSRFSLSKLTIDAVANDKVTFHFASVDVDRSDNSAPKDMPALTSVTVAVPAVGAVSFVDFRAADLHATTTGTWPFSPPASATWDLAIEQPASGDVRILLSPDVAVANATKLSLDTTSPPVDSTNTP